MSIPSQAQLLEAAIQYLELELLPQLEGEHKFKTRVALNALKIVQREAAAQSAASEPEEAALALQIRTGNIALDDPALLGRLHELLEQALKVNNPKWLRH